MAEFYQGNPLNLLRSCLFVCFRFFMILFPNPWQDVQWGNLRQRSFSVMKKMEFLSGEMSVVSHGCAVSCGTTGPALRCL